MSWSVSAIGRPEAVKKALAQQFASAKQNTIHIPAEQESVGLVEQLVNKTLDFAAENKGGAVKVEASGSASRESGGTYPGSIQVKVDASTIYGFVE